jgi:hypothetical protein
MITTDLVLKQHLFKRAIFQQPGRIYPTVQQPQPGMFSWKVMAGLITKCVCLCIIFKAILYKLSDTIQICYSGKLGQEP